MRYSDSMFDVLVYLYEHYWRPDAIPEAELLARKLSAVGFEAEEISEALSWLDGLALVAESDAKLAHEHSVRVYSSVELDHVGAQGLGYVRFLESAGVLTPQLRETILDRALAIPGGPVSLEDLKVIVLMVFWTAGEEPDALILDELFAEEGERAIH
jgi:Smg protein